jgi:radical SAM superfamily enzyme YgiQ (UPF0313 family)
MKILLAQTNINTYHPCALYPLGPGALSAFLKLEGHEVRGWIAHKTSMFPTFEAMLREFQPDVVGYSVITPQSPNIPVLADMVKRWNPKVPFICGGAHPSLAPEEVLAVPGVDAVCIGDGEHSTKEYLDSLAAGKVDTSIKGYWFKQPDGTIIRNELRPFIQDLDSLPFVDPDIVDHQAIMDENTGILWTLASRGCKWGCTFCAVPLLKSTGTGTYTRNRGVDHVIRELKGLKERFRFEIIIFRDDTFTWDRDWTLEFCEKYEREMGAFPFAMFSRSDCLDEELIKALAKAGCDACWIGLEAGNEHIRNDVIRKGIDAERFVEVCDLLNQNGIKPVVLNMVASPYETPEMFKETIEINRRVHAKYPMFSLGSGTGPKVFIFEPYPGTHLYELCQKNGWLREERLKVGFRTHVDTYVDIPTFPPDRAEHELRRFRYNVYKGTHPLISLFYLVYDSKTGETLREALPKTIFQGGINFFLKLVNR